MTDILLYLAAFLAGFVDSVVGGGGLIQQPSLFIAYPDFPPAVIFGTNKFAMVWATAVASWMYLRKVSIDRKKLAVWFVFSGVFSFIGAGCVRLVNPELFKPVIFFVMLGIALFTFFKKDIKHDSTSSSPDLKKGILISSAIGFYDGFIGPGTGTLLVFLFSAYAGAELLVASCIAKVVNLSSNLFALANFISMGTVIYSLALPLLVFNSLGAVVGSRLAISKGSAFIKTLLKVVIIMVLLRFGWDIFSTN